ncbi:class I lanthipeptide [Chryseobacterium sp. ON_d1]|uniref:class I lanthipeptide n=1 Tax=Chryseobacterium sp. ON_d1 TaxID=2583211 RepID=UPI00115A23A9|nr:hypothetical protein CRS_25800 [Chryseobacterium sp. ON_d1]
MNKKFSKLQLNKKSIAKLNDLQLNKVKGGKQGAVDHEIHCHVKTATVVTKVQN